MIQILITGKNIYLFTENDIKEKELKDYLDSKIDFLLEIQSFIRKLDN